MTDASFAGFQGRHAEFCVTASATCERHAIEADNVMQNLGAASKLNAGWDSLTDLHMIGRRKANAWLRGDFSKIGVESSTDIRDRYL